MGDKDPKKVQKVSFICFKTVSLDTINIAYLTGGVLSSYHFGCMEISNLNYSVKAG